MSGSRKRKQDTVQESRKKHADSVSQVFDSDDDYLIMSASSPDATRGDGPLIKGPSRTVEPAQHPPPLPPRSQSRNVYQNPNSNPLPSSGGSAAGGGG